MGRLGQIAESSVIMRWRSVKRTESGFTPDTPHTAPTAVGSGNAVTVTGNGGAQFSYPGGLDLNSFGLIVPQLRVGSVFGTEALLRWIAYHQSESDVGKVDLFGIGARHITVSTSGLAPQIRELANEPTQFRLALSLHGATDEVRGQIMPVNRRYPLKVLLEACDYYVAKKRRITFEYILIAGVNDTDEQARELAKIARRLSAKINLIPYNTVESLDWSRPSRPRQEKFQSILREHGVTATLRREKGHDIAAACGQLRLQTQRAEREPS